LLLPYFIIPFRTGTDGHAGFVFFNSLCFHFIIF
jgi:hypothetical protein